MAYEPAGIKVTNQREILRALKNIGVPNAAIKQAGKDAAEVVVQEARGLVPVRTGALRDTIELRPLVKGIGIKAGNNRKNGVPYANPIHWGWFRRGIKPNPFLHRALGYTRKEIFENYYRNIGNLIAEESAKARIAGTGARK